MPQYSLHVTIVCLCQSGVLGLFIIIIVLNQYTSRVAKQLSPFWLTTRQYMYMFASCHCVPQLHIATCLNLLTPKQLNYYSWLEFQLFNMKMPR